MQSAPIRTVHQVPATHGEFQRLYLDQEANRLRPNLRFVLADGSVSFDTNEIGLKGDPVDPQRKLAVVWGDSVVFGIGRGWPALIDDHVPGYQFLNGGIEGNGHSQVLERAIRMNREHPIALNILMIGWHDTQGRNANVHRDLLDAINNVPNPMLVTMPTALNQKIIHDDLSPYINGGDITDGFYFMGPMQYSVPQQIQLFEHITERNAIIRDTAAQTGVPVIDLFAAFDSTALTDFREYFFDVPHPRPSAYPKFAAAVAAAVNPLLQADWQYRVAAAPPPAAAPAPQRWLSGLRRALGMDRIVG